MPTFFLFELEMKDKAEKESKIICQMLEEMHSSYYSFHVQENFAILCQSPDDPEVSHALSGFIKTSLKYFLRNLADF